MPTPNDPVPPKKPVPPTGKPAEKPVSQIKPATGKPPIPVGKPAGAPPTGKPAAGTPPTGKPPAGTPPTGKPAGARGLITEDQLLQALGDQHGIKVVNLEDVKPTAEAVQLVPETMATVYKVLPLSYKDKVLIIAVADPANLSAVDDLRNLLGI